MSDEPLTLEKIRETFNKIPPGPVWSGEIIENSKLTVSETVARSWRERLLSWPWRPWRSTKTVQVPDPRFYKLDVSRVSFLSSAPRPRIVVFAHPLTAAKLRHELIKKGFTDAV